MHFISIKFFSSFSCNYGFLYELEVKFIQRYIKRYRCVIYFNFLCELFYNHIQCKLFEPNTYNFNDDLLQVNTIVILNI